MTRGRSGGAPLPLLLFVLFLPVFVLLATANAAGYRYGASDLAFYGPAVMRYLDPQSFPRDAVLIDAQARLTLMDETVGSIARLTTDNFPTLFFALYVVTLVTLAGGAALTGPVFYRHRWSTAALLAALTLRHAIARSGTNTLEPYFHPRQLAFGFGLLAVAAFLRGRAAAAALALVGAALLHPTTTLWFGIWLAVAVFVAEARWRRLLAAAAMGASLLAAWAFLRGPLAGRLIVMDGEWLAAITQKDYLFPLDWPPSAWALNLGYLAVIWFVYRRRARAGLLAERETPLVYGALALGLVFLAALVLNGARVALAIQLQPARVFWMLDLLATIYIVWALAEGVSGSARRAARVAALLVIASSVRGAYVMRVEFPDRPMFERGVPGDWGRTMAWAREQPRDTGWLADPNHASLYGTSVRMAAGRDVYVEATKDAAIGMYEKSIALRTQARLRELGDFSGLTPERARDIASRHSLHYMVTEQDLSLPLAFQAGALRVYRLR